MNFTKSTILSVLAVAIGLGYLLWRSVDNVVKRREKNCQRYVESCNHRKLKCFECWIGPYKASNERIWLGAIGIDLKKFITEGKIWLVQRRNNQGFSGITGKEEITVKNSIPSGGGKFGGLKMWLTPCSMSWKVSRFHIWKRLAVVPGS